MIQPIPMPFPAKFLFCFLGLVLGLSSCSPRDPAREPPSITVSPYSTLSDAELNVRYQAFLAELQKLNEEMSKANRIRDFDTVRDKAQNGVEKARAARRIASHIDDREVRRNRLKAIEDIIRDLDKLVEITR
ncbi:MAG: hypothetical protein CMP31_09150 [Roseibacillus sp.]|jgi:hypothetical protein|nr:hypothetical protein [Roseibacillus sp.]|tara:strand:- start:9017 stop:9412 length:396 start_codon:yes stop_codon:yes gene_type:complete